MSIVAREAGTHEAELVTQDGAAPETFEGQ